jgi:catechol 2,3-dioxygenase-like lactoylglutathione lyase family enzyme
MQRMMMLTAGCLALGLLGCKGKTEHNDPMAVAARACSQHAELSCPRPILPVASLSASQRYYRDALGFKIDWEHGDPPDFGSVSRGDSVLFLSQGGHGTPGAWMMMFTRDVDRLHDEFVRRKAIIKMPPTNMPWGMREMQVADPDGNVMRFGSSLDD